MKKDPASFHPRRRAPWGWLFVAALALAGGAGFLVLRRAPLVLASTSPVEYRAGERNPLLVASGYLVARHRATLSAKVPGRLAWLGVEEGTQVTKGQLLARLEDQDLKADLEATRAQLEQAALDLRRGEALFASGVLDRASLDHLRSALTVLQAQTANRSALLENMVIRAPFAGTVTQKLSEVGETVSPGTAGGLNAINAIATLADFGSLELEVEVNEAGLPRLTPGMPAEVRVDALEAEGHGRILRGLLREIYPTSNRQKATVLARVTLLDRDPILRPDMGAKVTFLGEPFTEAASFLGREQLVHRLGQTFVWILREGRAELFPVELQQEYPVGYQVKHLPAGLTLLVVPQETSLEPGRLVTLKGR